MGIRKGNSNKENQENALSIPTLATLTVAIVLLLFGLIYLVKSGFSNIQIPNSVIKYGYLGVPTIFIIRAIGDFKYVGFFKKIKNTEFAKADSKWFAPLCLIIGISGMLIYIL